MNSEKVSLLGENNKPDIYVMKEFKPNSFQKAISSFIDWMLGEKTLIEINLHNMIIPLAKLILAKKKDSVILLEPADGFDFRTEGITQQDNKVFWDFSLKWLTSRRTIIYNNHNSYVWRCCDIDTEQHPDDHHSEILEDVKQSTYYKRFLH